VTTSAPAAPTVRVLIADDEPSVLQLLSDLLIAHGGFEVATVGSGQEALDRLATFPADVILLDILMPGMSGNDTLSELRARGFQVPAIAITGAPDRAGTGFLAVLSKPIDMRQLIVLVSVAGRKNPARPVAR
jgi:CheY-like chemotaxis protein